MKKNAMFAFACIFALSACSSPSSTGQSSSSTESSSDSSSEPIDTGLVDYIATRAADYNGGLTTSQIMERSGLGKDAALTEGNVLRVLEACFKGYMPKMMGQRNLIAFAKYPSEAVITSNEVKSAMTWLSAYGLWFDFKNEASAISFDKIDTILARFYQYFGSNYKDDFNTSVNNSFYFYDQEDVGKSQMDAYRKSTLVDQEKIGETAIKYSKTFLASGSPYSSIYKGALDYMEGEADYSFLKEDGMASEIDNYANPTSDEDWLSDCSTMFKYYGGSPLMATGQVAFDTDAEGETNIAILDDFGYLNMIGNDFDKQTIIDALKKALSPYFKNLGFSDDDSSAKADLIIAFGKQQKAYYEDDFKDKAGKFSYILDSSTNKDIFETNGLSLSYASVLSATGLSSSLLPTLYVNDLGLTLATEKALEGASLETKGAISAYSFAYINKFAISYVQGEENEFDDIENLISRPLAKDFAGTKVWSDNMKLGENLVSSLLTSFSERSAASSWLSKDGATAIDGKLSNLKHYLFSSNSSEEAFDYTSCIDEWSNKLSKELGEYTFNSWQIISDGLDNGDSITEIDGKYLDPLTPNAFYTFTDNSIIVTLGYLFSYGGDFTSLSTEELYSTLGLVCGHEITHGFDSNGAYYDKNGKKMKTSIFPSDDEKVFLEKKEKVIALYDGKEYLPNSDYANKGSNTVTEAMADIGGLGLVEGMAAKVSGFDYKTFYTNLSIHMSDKRTILYHFFSMSDVHPAGKIRCNTMLSNSSKFISTFNISETDGMYLPSSKQVEIW